MKRSKWLALLLCIALCLCAGAWAEESDGATGAEIPPVPENYELVAENDRLALYLRRDIMAIILESKATGERMYSAVQNPEDMRDNVKWKGFYQSGVVMEYSNGPNPQLVQADLLNTANTIEYTGIDNGFTAKVYFEEIGIGYELSVTLDEAGLHVHMPQDKLVEEQEAQYKINTFYIFPFLGHTYQGQDAGYMIIPDGQGALIELKFNDGSLTNSYDRAVYGENTGASGNTFYEWFKEPENILMPVFGMVHTQKQLAVLGVIEEGDAAARITAYPNGVVTQFDWISAKFIYRLIYNQPTMIAEDGESSTSTINQATEHQRQFDIRLHYYVAEGEQATYTGLAHLYKEYLKEKGAFANADMSADFAMQVDFLGLEKENDLFGRREIVMTSFEQAGEILQELAASGAAKLTTMLRGWCKDGLTGGLPVRDYEPAASLGGKEGMESLLELGKELDVTVMAEADFLQMNLVENPGLRYSVFQKITGANYRRPTYKKVYESLYWTTPTLIEEYAAVTLEELDEAGWRDVALTGIPSLVSDYKEEKRYHDSTELMAIFARVSDHAASRMNLYLSDANSYLWRYADMLYAMPVGDSDFVLSTQSVPFLAIALSGEMHYYAEYVNFQANSQRFKLQLIEQGAFPAFVLTWEDPILLINSNSNNFYSTQWALYRDMILEWYTELEPVYGQIGSASIQDHAQIGNIVRVKWSNGVTVYINYGDLPQTLDGIELEGLTYKVVNTDV